MVGGGEGGFELVEVGGEREGCVGGSEDYVQEPHTH